MNTLPGSKAVAFPHMEFSAGLKPEIRSGFVYSDCRVDDSRLRAVGYGETRPVDPKHNEAAWSKNRRVEFKVLNTETLKKEVEKRRLLRQD